MTKFTKKLLIAVSISGIVACGGGGSTGNGNVNDDVVSGVDNDPAEQEPDENTSTESDSPTTEQNGPIENTIFQTEVAPEHEPGHFELYKSPDGSITSIYLDNDNFSATRYSIGSGWNLEASFDDLSGSVPLGNITLAQKSDGRALFIGLSETLILRDTFGNWETDTRNELENDIQGRYYDTGTTDFIFLERDTRTFLNDDLQKHTYRMDGAVINESVQSAFDGDNNLEDLLEEMDFNTENEIYYFVDQSGNLNVIVYSTTREDREVFAGVDPFRFYSVHLTHAVQVGNTWSATQIYTTSGLATSVSERDEIINNFDIDVSDSGKSVAMTFEEDYSEEEDSTNIQTRLIGTRYLNGLWSEPTVIDTTGERSVRALRVNDAGRVSFVSVPIVDDNRQVESYVMNESSEIFEKESISLNGEFDVVSNATRHDMNNNGDRIIAFQCGLNRRCYRKYESGVGWSTVREDALGDSDRPYGVIISDSGTAMVYGSGWNGQMNYYTAEISW